MGNEWPSGDAPSKGMCERQLLLLVFAFIGLFTVVRGVGRRLLR